MQFLFLSDFHTSVSLLRKDRGSNSRHSADTDLPRLCLKQFHECDPQRVTHDHSPVRTTTAALRTLASTSLCPYVANASLHLSTVSPLTDAQEAKHLIQAPKPEGRGAGMGTRVRLPSTIPAGTEGADERKAPVE